MRDADTMSEELFTVDGLDQYAHRPPFASGSRRVQRLACPLGSTLTDFTAPLAAN